MCDACVRQSDRETEGQTSTDVDRRTRPRTYLCQIAAIGICIGICMHGSAPGLRLSKFIYIVSIYTSVEMLSRKFYEEQGLASLSRASLTASFASTMPVIPAAKEEKGPMSFLLDLAAGGTRKDGVGGWDGGVGIPDVERRFSGQRRERRGQRPVRFQ